MLVPTYLYNDVATVYRECRKRARSWKKRHDFSVFESAEVLDLRRESVRRRPNPSGYVLQSKSAFAYYPPGANFVACAVQDTIVDTMGVLVETEPGLAASYVEWVIQEPWRIALTLEDSAARWISFAQRDGIVRYLRGVAQHWDVLDGVGARYCFAPMPEEFWEAAGTVMWAMTAVGVPEKAVLPGSGRGFHELVREFVPEVLGQEA